jgi:hypothetical protein
MKTFLAIIGALALISIALVTLAIIGNSLPISPPQVGPQADGTRQPNN